jgi:glycosyltransferase involved in cell wall biosynthesis
MTRCSVIIPTYNRADLLAYTLDSLVRQDLTRADFEVLVVDDGSADRTAELVEGYHDRLRLRYLFQPDRGWRVAQARNLGLAEATGEVCLFVDTGVLLHSGCLRAHLASHQPADEPLVVLGYVHGYGLEGDQADEFSRAVDPADPDASIAAFGGRWPDIRESLYLRYADRIDGLPAPWILHWTCNVSTPTDRLRAIGGFDEQFRSWGGEDIDLGYRLHLAGARFVLNRTASSIHYPHGANFAHNMDTARDNHRYMVAKFGTPVSRLLPLLGGALNYHTFNDVILARRLPDCREYLRDRAWQAR